MFPDPGNYVYADGGGIRGMSSLYILERVMEKIKAQTPGEDRKPSEYFDLIGGTSTGG